MRRARDVERPHVRRRYAVLAARCRRTRSSTSHFGPLAGRRDDLAAPRTAGDRHGAARGDPRAGDPGCRRPRRRRWRRHLRTTELGMGPGDGVDRARPLRLEGQRPDRRAAGRRRVHRRHRHHVVAASPTRIADRRQTACADAIDGGEPEVTDERLATSRSTPAPSPSQRCATSTIRRCDGCRDVRATSGARRATRRRRRRATSDVAALAEPDDPSRTPICCCTTWAPDLADDRPDFEATGSEWRTPPLWGLGLVDEVNGERYLLHDGRARTFEEAILWHGGEGAAAAEAFRTAAVEDRRRLARVPGGVMRRVVASRVVAAVADTRAATTDRRGRTCSAPTPSTSLVPRTRPFAASAADLPAAVDERRATTRRPTDIAAHARRRRLAATRLDARTGDVHRSGDGPTFGCARRLAGPRGRHRELRRLAPSRTRSRPEVVAKNVGADTRGFTALRFVLASDDGSGATRRPAVVRLLRRGRPCRRRRGDRRGRGVGRSR